MCETARIINLFGKSTRRKSILDERCRLPMSATAMDTEGGAESVMMEKDTVDDRSINLHPVSFHSSLSRPSCLRLISSAFPQGRDRRPPHYQAHARRHNSVYALARTCAATTVVRRRVLHFPVFRVVCPCARLSDHTHTHNTTAFILFSPRPHIHLTCASLLFSPRPARDHQYL